MATDEVADLRRDMFELRTDVNKRLDIIHAAVLSLAGRVSIPGPSMWKRLAGWVGLVKLG